jgi:hypothetical protein
MLFLLHQLLLVLLRLLVLLPALRPPLLLLYQLPHLQVMLHWQCLCQLSGLVVLLLVLHLQV